MYTHIYYKKLLLFSSLYIRMNGKSINFNDKKNLKKLTFITKTKKYLI